MNICHHKTHIRIHQSFYNVLSINSLITLTMCYNYQIVCSRTLQYLLMSRREHTGLNFYIKFFEKSLFIYSEIKITYKCKQMKKS